MTDHVAFFCCPAAHAAGFAQGMIEPIGAIGQPGSAKIDGILPQVAIEAMPVDLATAWHEAGHAIVGELEGYRLGEIRIVHPWVTRWLTPDVPMTVRQAMRKTLAGPIAERWQRREIFRAHDEELLFYVHAIRDGRGGRCDFCQAFGYIREVRPDDDDASTLSNFRAIEAETIEIVTSRPVTNAIRALAVQLIDTPVMTGDEVRALIDRFLR